MYEDWKVKRLKKFFIFIRRKYVVRFKKDFLKIELKESM